MQRKKVNIDRIKLLSYTELDTDGSHNQCTFGGAKIKKEDYRHIP